MKNSLRIVVADDEPIMRDYFEKVLPELGHQVVAVAGNGRDLVEQCRKMLPDLVITDIKMPDTDGIDAAARIFRDRPTPIILLSAYHDRELVARAESEHIFAYLVKPVKEADLGPAIAVAMRRFEQFHAVSQEAADLRQALEDRKLIERAKGVLMKHASVDEKEAFHRMQRQAMDRRCKLVEIARMILTAEEAFQPNSPGATPGPLSAKP
jgi:response regulator NasT